MTCNFIGGEAGNRLKQLSVSKTSASEKSLDDHICILLISFALSRPQIMNRKITGVDVTIVTNL